MMPAAAFTPKQVALALGVSESSVKRWVDSGRIRAAKTAGGHRKLPLTSVTEFVRETGHPVERPEILGMVAAVERSGLESLRGELFDAVIAGRDDVCRELLLGLYQRGESIVDLGDRLIAPVFGRIGDGWEAGSVQVFEERRACETVMASLHELRRWLPAPPPSGPTALVATPHQDFAEVPARLVELTLAAAGWRVTLAGSGLPMSEVRDAALRLAPRLVCISATHLADPAAFARDYRRDLVEPLRRSATPPAIAVGGAALHGAWVADLDGDLVAASLGDLAAYERTLRLGR